jgi:cytosine/adenosine deaminase-related metal-dependent hydrolase
MIEHGCTVALGTDNVMLNSPDMFREMDYAWKVTRALDGTLLEPRQILKMATVNGAKILRLNSGCIEVGRDADLIFIDKTHIDISPMHDPYAAVVHRANQDCLSAVMIGGEFARTLN